ncbi:MAG: SDR family oxidoreductase [Candidatus Omnitrophica bacterium]|nr:SDR family oxidoreductase [Candidatus Omnitrophota bacterium]MBI2173900.1 SDR family oxidoreductase [Candidatus Omnitrophota bacterium]
MAHYLVTGGAGFIGSHMAENLLAAGHTVRVLDDLSSGKLQNIEAVKNRIEFLKADIRDRAKVRSAMEGIEFVLHAAAWRSVPKSMADPYGYADVNVLATVNLLEAAANAKVKRFVCVSSSSVYGETTQMPLREDQPANPISPYAASKLADELFCALFARSFGLETVAVRYFNVFGPRQSLENDYAVVIPKFIHSLLRGEPPPVYGDGKQSRDFTYVDNVVEATILASQAPGISGEVFNIALGEEHTVLDLLAELNTILKLSVAPSFKPARPGDVQRTLADPSKATRLLHWQGRIRFAEGLRRTVEWFRAHPSS